jgi:hypothetical protein
LVILAAGIHAFIAPSGFQDDDHLTRRHGFRAEIRSRRVGAVPIGCCRVLVPDPV